jgi:putative membrane protein
VCHSCQIGGDDEHGTGLDDSHRHDTRHDDVPPVDTLGSMREPKWRETGDDPDYRFSLANERTFLAWIRTALAILAGGVLLEEFSSRIGPHWLIVVLAVVLGALSTVLAVIAYLRWRANEIAMRNGRRLPLTIAVPLIAAVVLAVGAVLTVLIAIYGR